MVSKTLPGDVFSSTMTHMKIFREFMKKNFVENLTIFSNFTHFYVYFPY
eukprot:UN17144